MMNLDTTDPKKINQSLSFFTAKFSVQRVLELRHGSVPSTVTLRHTLTDPDSSEIINTATGKETLTRTPRPRAAKLVHLEDPLYVFKLLGLFTLVL